jgi:hypothetical protein
MGTYNPDAKLVSINIGMKFEKQINSLEHATVLRARCIVWGEVGNLG